MPSFTVDSFPGGLDLRRPEWAQRPGSASIAENVHLTRAGDWEVRKAFVPEITLPVAQTVGLAALNEQKYVFGAGTRPTLLDASIGYQQLVPPGGQSILRVESWDVYDGKLYVAVRLSDQSIAHYYDGVIVGTWTDGRARGEFEITGGTAGGGNTVSSVRVNGVEILNVSVAWATSNSATAAAVAAQINSFASTPEYTAISIGPRVIVLAATAAGDTINGAALTVTVGGNVTVGNVSAMSGGTSIAGTYTPGPFVLTHDSKMYVASGPRLHFSSVISPVQYNPDYPGAGFVTISNHTSGAADLVGLGVYLADLAIFTEKAVQIWDVEADDAQNARKQTIPNSGTKAPRTIKPFGDTGLFWLDRRGIRALQPSATLANFALVSEIGTPIDPLVLSHVKATDPAIVQRAFTVVEPIDNRMLMCVGNRAFVLTLFPEARVAGFSTYVLDFVPDEGVVVGDQLWLRAGNVLYCYGGASGDVYDDTVPRIRLPGLNGAAPATLKDFVGMDVGAEGEWEIKQQYEIGDATLGTASITFEPTFDGPAIPTIGFQTSPTLELVGRGSGYKRLVSVTLHFKSDVSE